MTKKTKTYPNKTGSSHNKITITNTSFYKETAPSYVLVGFPNPSAKVTHPSASGEGQRLSETQTHIAQLLSPT